MTAATGSGERSLGKQTESQSSQEADGKSGLITEAGPDGSGPDAAEADPRNDGHSPSARELEPAEAEVHDLAAHRHVHAVTKPIRDIEARSSGESRRNPVRGLLNHVARLSPLVLLVTDLLALIATDWFVENSRVLIPSFPVHLPQFPFDAIFLVYLPILGLLRLYSPPQGVHQSSLVSELPRLVAGSAIAAAFMAVVLGQRLELSGAALTASVTVLGLVLFRSVLHMTASVLRRRGYGVRKTLIVGRGHSVQSLVGKIGRHPEIGLRVVGVISQDESEELGLHAEPARVGGRPEDLPEIVTRLGIEQLILVPEDADTKFVSDCFMAVDGFKVHASLVPPLQDFLLSPSNVEQIEGIPLISLGRLSYAPRMMPGKRVFDFIGASLAIVLLSPVILLTALAIKLDDRGPVFFRQKRAGYRGRYFRMIKFRSMCVDAEARLAALESQNESDGLLFKIKEDPRITRVGRFIRKTSLDELPQFFNVLKGDMSLVGPRGLPVEVEHFGDIAIKRLNVRPGVTGYWQVLGRSDLTYDEMVKLDLAYIQNWSLWVDVQLILKTLPVIFGRKGAY